jgi:hypothetical protein
MMAEVYTVQGRLYFKIGNLLLTDTELRRANNRLKRFLVNHEVFVFRGFLDLDGGKQIGVLERGD